MVTVLLTLDAEEDDLGIKERHGVTALRQYRIERLCHEAYQKGGFTQLWRTNSILLG